jgi:hypothetical protein
MNNLGNDPFIYNTLYKHRDRLLGVDVNWKAEDNGGIEEFDEIDISTLNALIELKFVDPDSRQNESPSAGEIQAFMTKNPQVKACGYAVSPYRDDYRTTVDMIFVEYEDVTDDLKRDFIEFTSNADTVDTSYDLCAWWD